MAPITQVHARAGDRVRRGNALVTLDTRDIQAEKGRAEAASRSAVELARSADADVRSAESALVLARATHDRMAALHARKSATTQELDQAVAALTAAEAQRASARSASPLPTLPRLLPRPAPKPQRSPPYAVLLAPFDGVVVERHADPGSMAMPGNPLLTLEDPATYRLEVQVDEARASGVTTGQVVSVHLDNAAGRSDGIAGRVTEIARVDPVSHAFREDRSADVGDVALGMFGRARFPGPSRPALTYRAPP